MNERIKIIISSSSSRPCLMTLLLDVGPPPSIGFNHLGHLSRSSNHSLSLHFKVMPRPIASINVTINLVAIKDMIFI